jgi:hypothetical protein
MFFSGAHTHSEYLRRKLDKQIMLSTKKHSWHRFEILLSSHKGIKMNKAVFAYHVLVIFSVTHCVYAIPTVEIVMEKTMIL